LLIFFLAPRSRLELAGATKWHDREFGAAQSSKRKRVAFSFADKRRSGVKRSDTSPFPVIH